MPTPYDQRLRDEDQAIKNALLKCFLEDSLQLLKMGRRHTVMQNIKKELEKINAI